MCGALELTPQVSDLWREYDNGPVAGLGREEALKRYSIPDFRHDFAPPSCVSGESQAQIRARALITLHELWALPHANILVVSHGAPLN